MESAVVFEIFCPKHQYVCGVLGVKYRFVSENRGCANNRVCASVLTNYSAKLYRLVVLEGVDFLPFVYLGVVFPCCTVLVWWQFFDVSFVV